jgi:hypothetical protein
LFFHFFPVSCECSWFWKFYFFIYFMRVTKPVKMNYSIPAYVWSWRNVTLNFRAQYIWVCNYCFVCTSQASLFINLITLLKTRNVYSPNKIKCKWATERLAQTELWRLPSSEIWRLVAYRNVMRPSERYIRPLHQNTTSLKESTRWRSWLRHCATTRKVAGSVPDGVIGIFHWHNPSGRTIALGLAQPLTEISAKNIFWW